MKKYALLCGLISLVTAWFPALANEGYLWPLKLHPELTSKFCDYRAGHFHSGLDIRTQGKTGFPVYATADGYVYRISVSFRGYGKALYLKLNDGNYAVFGHLSNFTEPVRERVRSAQLKESKYTQDLFFQADEFPVKRGDIVAYTGDSGSGAPHLHFEIRSPQNNPINPLIAGIGFQDKEAPEFDYLAVRYYKNGFALGDPCELEFLPAVKSKAGDKYAIADTIISDEHLVLSASGGDRVNGPGFLYGFFGLGLYIDDSLSFGMDSDSLSFASTRQLNYVRDLENIRQFGAKKKTDNDANIFFRLFVPPGANQYFWKAHTDGAGVMAPRNEPGVIRHVKLSAYDEFKNQSELGFVVREPELPRPDVITYSRHFDTLTVEFVTPVRTARIRFQQRNSPSAPFKNVNCQVKSRGNGMAGEPYSNTIRLVLSDGEKEMRFIYFDESGRVSPWTYAQEGRFARRFEIFGSPDYLKIRFTPRASLGRLSLSVENSERILDLEMPPFGPHRYSADIMGQNLSGPTRFVISAPDGEIFDTSLVLYPVYPDSSASISSPDSTLQVSFQPGSTFYTAYVFPSAAARAAVTVGSGIVYDLQPDAFVSNLPVKYKFDIAKLGLTGRKVAAYGYSYSSGGWSFIGKAQGTRLETNGFGLGKIALIEDNEPPVISSISPSGKTKARTPLLSCTIRDKVSGLALDAGISMTIDGIWVPAEYDIDNRRFTYKVRNSLSPGLHKLEIKAADNQGNTVTKTVNFTVTAK